ncbi:aldo/keto reductase [Solirubrobacter phytolaccae]|uniref:Aldo/keto reductase n=1 Tax=Solirubrobacter phytolaccae TaxID=1404360 RepID=A0A9X3NF58_9ACTN|nr:aldo/keto reductase [Solirubrobacter phytolaccae]MDA0184921.1 aldo/keto reductase [Solirubrobacter phytolaccae]
MRPLGRGGLQVGPLSFGSAPIGNLGRAVSDEEWRGALAAAWDAGIRYFDTAPHYGLGLAERRLACGLAEREGFIVSTKVGRLLEPTTDEDLDDEGYAVPPTHIRVRDYTRDGIRASLEASLERLGLDRVDILLVHDPDEHYREALDGAFPALEELRAEGVITSYGAGMNQAEMLADFVRHTDLDVVMLAGRYTLLEQGALDELLPLCVERDVSVIAAGVFNSGLLSRPRPRESATYNYEPAPPELLARVHRIADVLERHGTTLPAAAAQFALAHPAVSTVCLGARSADQVERNAALFDDPIPDAVWGELVAEGLLRPDAPVP